MFNLTKLSSDAQSFLTQASSDGRSRSICAAIALARMISAEFSIPTTPVVDVEQHYRLNSEILANTIVSDINELVPVDTKLVLELTRKFFVWRYYMVHPTKHVFSFRSECVLEDFFGLSRVFSCEILDEIRKNGERLAWYTNGFAKIRSDLVDADDKNAARARAEQVV